MDCLHCYPFVWPELAAPGSNPGRSADAPLTLTLLVGVCFIAVLLEAQQAVISVNGLARPANRKSQIANPGGSRAAHKLQALLGVLVAINATLRFAETAIPGPAGFSPIFFLIVLTGYAYGGHFGFLMGALTLLVSALITGGVGPWLPYQMLTAGWVGLTAPLCRLPVHLAHAQGRWPERVVLTAFSVLWGFAYGFIINLWFWPFMVGPGSQAWQAGLSLWETVQRYLAFYVTTSLLWDVARAAGNFIIMALFAMPVLKALQRFQRRFAFSYHYETSNIKRKS